MSERPDITSPADVQRLVAAFYAKARYDPALAHFFTHVDWAHHIPRIEAFWNMILFGDKSFHGDPMTAHVQLAREKPMSQAHFDRWLDLFTATIEDLFVGPKAEEAKQRAHTIAAVMAHKVGA